MNGGSVYVTVDGHFKPVHVSMKGTGEEGFLEFMLEDVEKALKETEMPVMGMMYYNVPDMGIVPRLREGNNDDYLQRLEKAMDGHLNPVHVSMKGTGEEGFTGVYAGRCGEGAQGNGNAYHGHDVL